MTETEISIEPTRGAMTPPLLSVVVPVLNEQDNIRPLVTEIITALDGVCDFEIVYVDDGSDDDTPNILDRLADGGMFETSPRDNLETLAIVEAAYRMSGGTGC